MLDQAGAAAKIEVDGGIKPSNAAEIVAAGADILVAGSAIFGGPQAIIENIQGFRKAIAAARSVPI